MVIVIHSTPSRIDWTLNNIFIDELKYGLVLYRMFRYALKIQERSSVRLFESYYSHETQFLPGRVIMLLFANIC